MEGVNIVTHCLGLGKSGSTAEGNSTMTIRERLSALVRGMPYPARPAALIAETYIAGAVIETLRLAMPDRCEGVKLCYKTRVCGGRLHGDRFGYASERAARAGHRWVVKRVRRLEAARDRTCRAGS